MMMANDGKGAKRTIAVVVMTEGNGIWCKTKAIHQCNAGTNHCGARNVAESYRLATH